MKAESDRLIRCPSQCGDEAYVADARETAYLWHGGQASALYAFASTGTVLPGLGSSARACADHCHAMTPEERARQELSDDDVTACNIMADICAALEAELTEEESA